MCPSMNTSITTSMNMRTTTITTTTTIMNTPTPMRGLRMWRRSSMR